MKEHPTITRQLQEEYLQSFSRVSASVAGYLTLHRSLRHFLSLYTHLQRLYRLEVTKSINFICFFPPNTYKDFIQRLWCWESLCFAVKVLQTKQCIVAGLMLVCCHIPLVIHLNFYHSVTHYITPSLVHFSDIKRKLYVEICVCNLVMVRAEALKILPASTIKTWLATNQDTGRSLVLPYCDSFPCYFLMADSDNNRHADWWHDLLQSCQVALPIHSFCLSYSLFHFHSPSSKNTFVSYIQKPFQ